MVEHDVRPVLKDRSNWWRMTSDLHEWIAEKAVDVVYVRRADPVRVSDQETLAMTELVDKGLAKPTSAANQMQGQA